VYIVVQAHYPKSGRPGKGQTPTQISYHIQATLVPDSAVVKEAQKSAGQFILATNVLEKDDLTPSQALVEYKEQQSAERGFRFLKDPLFFTSSVFLKSPNRIMALAMVMGVSLLVYTLAQRRLRQTLQAGQTGIKINLRR
jgi:transposase